jgi:hypothetical protein
MSSKISFRKFRIGCHLAARFSSNLQRYSPVICSQILQMERG